ncbi:MAG: transposase [Filifactoraceae bacterium]
MKLKIKEIYHKNNGTPGYRMIASELIKYKVFLSINTVYKYMKELGLTTASSSIPPSGSGVNFNRQITLVDTAHNATSGLYLQNASFYQSYIYNNSSTQIFNDNNTNSSRRGKFGCSWAADSKVTINSNPHWYSENIAIKMK